MGPDRPLAAAAKRLRKPAGRPRMVRPPMSAGSRNRGAAPIPAPMAAGDDHRASTVSARALSMREASIYLGVSRSQLYQFVGRGLLPLIKLPGCRRALLLRDDLDQLLIAHRTARPPP
jgi:excisionase family DNA binding protein